MGTVWWFVVAGDGVVAAVAGFLMFAAIWRFGLPFAAGAVVIGPLAWRLFEADGVIAHCSVRWLPLF